MSVATGTAIAIGVGAAGAASSLASAKIAANASKSAAKTQAAAGQQALNAQQQGYQQQRQDFSPYLQAGTTALGRLGQTAGTYTGGMPQPQGPPPQMPQRPQQAMGSLGSLGAPQGPPPGAPPPQMGGAQGGLVRVQAPTGEVAMLPMAVAQQAVQKGAKILQDGPQGMPPGGMQGRV